MCDRVREPGRDAAQATGSSSAVSHLRCRRDRARGNCKLAKHPISDHFDALFLGWRWFGRLSSTDWLLFGLRRYFDRFDLGRDRATQFDELIRHLL